jgi:regulator of protease activity HflC (stomatin/prohibitin superfamily)
MKPLSRLVALSVVVVALAGAGCAVSCVRTGHTGVVTTFGAVTGRQLAEGLNVVAPWQSVHQLSIRTQEIKETATTPSNEGLVVGLDVSVLFRLSAERAREIYQTVGDNYVEVIVVPNLRSAIRTATAAHKAESLYGEAREQIASEILQSIQTQLEPRGVVVERVLLRDVTLPEKLRTAIEAKQQAEQESLQMQFVLAKERQEAERKRVEAQGIKDFQDIVTQGISDKLLQWKGIEATERLSSSANAKVVIIGSGANGLPIILGGGN